MKCPECQRNILHISAMGTVNVDLERPSWRCLDREIEPMPEISWDFACPECGFETTDLTEFHEGIQDASE